MLAFLARGAFGVATEPAVSLRGLQLFAELAGEHLRERRHRKQESWAAFRLDPLALAIPIQGTGGDQRVRVDMDSQVLGPGMQHQRKRWPVPPSQRSFTLNSVSVCATLLSSVS